MGQDVLLYAEVTPSKEELIAAELVFNALSNAGNGWPEPSLVFHEAMTGSPWVFENTNARVELKTLYRWWGRGSNSGWWPQICKAILAMQICFPDSEVFYGSDSSYNGELVTMEWIEEMWVEWYKQGNKEV